MTAKELFESLVQDAGLDEATAKAIMAAAANEKVNAKAAGLVQRKEYDSLEARAAALELSMNGTKDKPGAVAYQKWYTDNFAAIQKLQQDVARYTERYGTLDEPKNPPANPPAPAFDEKKIAEMIAAGVDKRIQEGYGSRWSDLITQSGTILEKHIRSGRKSPLDWKKISELAAAKNGDIAAAYDEWDKPEADAAAKAATDAEVERRVKERLAKERTESFFPAGADATPSGSVSPLSRSKVEGTPKYDRSSVIAAAVTGKYDGGKESVQ